nr:MULTISPECIES: hypothetical protein [unclassified Pedobacter]
MASLIGVPPSCIRITLPIVELFANIATSVSTTLAIALDPGLVTFVSIFPVPGSSLSAPGCKMV